MIWQIKDAIKNNNFLPLVFISILFVVNYFTFNDVLILVGTIMAVMYILCCGIYNVVPAIIFFSFFSQIILFQNINVFVLIASAVIVRSCLCDVSRILKYISFLLLYIILHTISTDFSNTSLSFFIPSVLFLTLYACCDLIDHNQVDFCIESFLNGFIVSTCAGFVVALGLSSRLSQLMEADFVYHGESAAGALRFSGLAYDCNFYAVLCVMVIGILLFKHQPKYFSSMRNTAILIFAIVFGMLTFSISFNLCFFVLIMIRNLRVSKEWILGWFVAGALCIVLYIAFFSQANYFISEIVSRFARTDNMNSFTSGRTDLWVLYFLRYVQNIDSVLFGYGYGNHDIWSAVHNTYLEILYTYGLIGLISDFIMIKFNKYAIFKHNFKYSNFSAKLITFTFYLMIFFLSAYTFYSLFICILMTFLLSVDRTSSSEKIIVKTAKS